jgi:hypothetical protein
MKKLFLPTFIAFPTVNSYGAKYLKMLLLAFLFSLVYSGGYANVTVTAGTGGTGICPTKAVGGGATAYTALGTITVTEGATNDLSTGTNVITLAPPTGWQFNTSVAPTYGFTLGRDITAISSSYSSGNLVISVVCSGAGLSDQFTITNLQVEATSTAASAGNITATSSFVAGITTGSSVPPATDFGALSLGSGLTPSISISVSPSGSVCAGTGLTFTPSLTNGGTTPTIQWFVNSSLVGAGGTYSTSALSNGDVVNAVLTASGGGCFFPLTGTSNNVTASINALPTTVVASGGGSFCGSTTITASGGTGGTIYYQGNTSNGTSTATPSTSQVVASSGTYYFRAQSAAGCWGPQGSVAVTINAVPAAVSVSGGTTTCGTSQTITASGGLGGTIYFQGTTSGGTSTAAPSISQSVSTSGTYYFRSQSAGGCWGTEGSTVVVVNPLPTAFSVTGTGSYCTGGSGLAIGLANSEVGVSYQLFRGGVATGIVVAGTGSAITFGLQTIANTYTVVGTNTTTTCTNNMTGSAVITVNPLPTVYAMSGGGNYCSGGAGIAVGLANSTVGVNYQLMLLGSPVGSAVAGTGSAISFGLKTLSGTYTAVATDGNGCTSNMSGTSVVGINPLPTAFSVTGGGQYCTGGAGVTVGLFNSSVTETYQLYLGGVAVGPSMAGTGSAISFGLQTGAGTYTVLATTTSTGCTNTMTGSATVTMNPLPNVYTVTGGGNYCTGGTGVHVGLTSSDAGVSYQLFIGGVATGAPVTGTGSAIDFGLKTVAGTYTVVATGIATTCTSNMAGSATISLNPLPLVFTVSGGGNYCAGGTGVNVDLSGSEAGINYQLFDGGVSSGGPVAGTGAGFTFGAQTLGGVYTAVATNPITGCTSNMTGSATVVVNPLPVVYTVTGGGGYCAGGTGLHVRLSGSDPGINYQLLLGGVAVPGGLKAGTGAALDFGLQTSAGNYTVVATNSSTLCSGNMNGTVNITINALPNVYSVTSFGINSYCAGGTGVTLFLLGSDPGISYQLFVGGVAVGAPTIGTGGFLNLGAQTMAGTYTVVATDPASGCTSNMSGSVTISIDPLPTAFAVTGGGPYCIGGTGAAVGLPGSQVGVDYQLFLAGSPVGATVAGTGAAITFGLQTATGIYTVVGTNSTTLCTNNMTGSVTIFTNPLPNVYTVSAGGAYCAGGAGVDIQLSSSDIGNSYQLFVGGVITGAAMAGTGSALDFGLQTTAGVYTVVATTVATGCTNNMAGSGTISINPLPIANTVTGGGSFCSGGPGVLVGLSGSEVGVDYQLSNLFSPLGAPMAGTGSAISFGLQTAAGFYTIDATNTTTGCTNSMTGGVAVTVLPLPTAFDVTGTGAYCAGGPGVDIGLSGSDLGVSYELWFNGVATGIIMAGTGSALDFGLQTFGSYTIVATDGTTLCTNNMNGAAVVTVNPLPIPFAVFGGGPYCAGGPGVHILIGSSIFGTDYQLYNGGLPVSGALLSGNGGALDFGLQTAAGTYTVVGTIVATGCSNNMIGSATISINPLPTAYSMSAGGGYCVGDPGVDVQLLGSDVGIDYQLFNGAVMVGSAVAGTGSAIDFGVLTAGSYTVVASDPISGCTNNMTGVANVVQNALPTVYTISAGGAYCAGGLGFALTLSGSDLNVDYQVMSGGSPVGALVTGTGVIGTLDLGVFPAGTYTVHATSTAGCQMDMAGTATVTTNPLPNAYTVSAGGNYCAGGGGVDITLSSSDVGISYELWLGVSSTGIIIPGTGSSLDFGFQTAAGTYSIIATNTTTGCTNVMTGTSIIGINPLPTVFTVSGGGPYCAGGAGVPVILSGSEVGVNYRTYITGVAANNDAGTGSTLIDIQTTAGIYTIVATNAATTCSVTMTGSATVVVNPLPAAITGATNICQGATTTMSDATPAGQWSSSNTAIATINPVTGLVTGVGPGIYSILYTVTATGCVTASIDTVTAYPVVSSISGPVALCANYTNLFADVTVGGVWSSSNTSIVTIDAFGVATGGVAGSATISYTVATYGCATTVTAPLTVLASPVVAAITGAGGATNVCAGLTILLGDVTPGGVWTSSNTTIAVVSSTGIMTGVAFGSADISYTVTNGSGCKTSALYGVSIGNAMPPLGILPAGSATICHGNPVNLSVVTSGSGLTYQWAIGGSDIPGETNSTYVATTTGLYTATVDNASCHVTLPAINVIAPPMPVIAFDSLANILYTGSFAGYQWFRDNNMIPGATTYSIPKDANGDYTVAVTDGNGCTDTSMVFTVTDIIVSKVKTIINGGDIKVYPNPATSIIYIDAPEKVYVTVMSTDGKMLMAQKEAVSINISQLPDGVYMLMIYGENNMLLKADKIVKIQ